jgi:dihydropteroate synthase
MGMLRLRGRTVSWSRPLLMGILNVNSDSFSDPGPRTTDKAVETALSLIANGAAIIDIGAQSSATNRVPVTAEGEAAAITPVVRALTTAAPDVLVSVDTFKPPVAEAALAAGAHMVNDVSGLRVPAIAALCARHGAGLVVLHTTAPPLTRRQHPGRYTDVAKEVAAFLAARVDAAIAAGVPSESIIVDPGPDFTKTPAQSIELLRNLDPIVALGHPVMLALSRKDFVGALTRRPPAERDSGTLGAIAALRDVPDQILRVHDVAGVRDMLAIMDALRGAVHVPSSLALPDKLRHQRPGHINDSTGGPREHSG